MRLFSPAFAAAAIAICLFLTAERTPALAQPLTVVKAEIGLGGKFKAGFWNPVWLTVKSGEQGAKGRLELVIPDGDQVPVIYADQPASQINLSAGEAKRLLLYAKTGPLAAPVKVQLRGDTGIVWSQDITPLVGPPLLPTQELAVSVGPSVQLADVPALVKGPAELALAASEVRSPAGLPDQWWGYEGVDSVVLMTSDQKFMDQISRDQREALLQWVRLGGRLVLCVGAGGQSILAENSPWAQLAPGKLADVVPLRDGTALETFTASKLPRGEELFERNRPLASRLVSAEGVVLVEEGGAITADRPLVVRAPFGLGQVFFVGLDLDHPALAKWKGRPSLLARLLTGSERHNRGDSESTRSVTHLGYEDIVGQLRAALDQFSGVTLVNFTTVSILTIVYLLMVGPGDYLLLSRLGWPRQATWITFSIIAVALGAVAWLFGGQSHGHRARINQAEIVDIDAERGVVRGTTWVHLFSPATDHFDPQLQFNLPPTLSSPGSASPAGWLAWQGLPGDSLGGLGSRQVALAAAEPYVIGPPGPRPAIRGLPVQVASSKSLSARWWSQANLHPDARLVENQFGVLTGEFRQPLAVELTDCLLIHGEKLFRLGKLQPGQTVHLEDFAALNLEARLTQRTVVMSKDVSTPWDRASTDVPRILLMMMFHHASRGSSYTGLTNRYQPNIDLTDQVHMGRAILCGRAAKRFCQLSAADGHSLVDEDATQSWTWCRVILPVSPPESAPSP